MQLDPTVYDILSKVIPPIVGAIAGFLISTLYNRSQEPRRRDRDLLSFYQGVFSRDAFCGRFDIRSEPALREKFKKEIEATELAVRTGWSRSASGAQAGYPQGRPFGTINNQNWQKTMQTVDDRLNHILQILEDGSDNDMESVLFHPEDLKNSGPLVVLLQDEQRSLSRYLREQFSSETQQLLHHYHEQYRNRRPRKAGRFPSSYHCV